MNIEWMGHSCFKLTESTGTTIITDPYEKSIVGIEMKKTNADVVTCSHQHKDHNAVVNVLFPPMELSECGFWDVKCVDISTVFSYLVYTKGEKRVANGIFNLRIDDYNRCPMGDIG